MAAFCACCGAEVGERAEACVVCGTPRHGMLPAGGLAPLDSLGELNIDLDIQRPDRCDPAAPENGPVRE
jgi:hypothetical protein